MIMDTLSQVMGRRERKKLADFEKKSMEKIHSLALMDDGEPNLNVHIEKMKEELREKYR